MLPDGQLHCSQPKVFRARAGVICAVLALRGLMLLVAVAGLLAFAYFSWQEARTKDEPIPWWTIVGCVVGALLFVWSCAGWTARLLASFGQQFTLDAEGVALEKDYHCVRFAWGDITQVDRRDHQNEHNLRHGIIAGLVNNYLGWLSNSSLTIHAADGRTIVVTPLFERYDELCGYVRLRQKRQAQSAASGE